MKNNDIENRQNIFQIYLISYKKFKYWFTVFSFLSIIFYIWIYNEGISEYLKQYRSMESFLNDSTYIASFADINKKYTQENIISYSKAKFIYKIKNGNWLEGEQQKLAYLPIIPAHIDTLNKYTDYQYSQVMDSLKQILKYDSLMIEDIISKYDIEMIKYEPTNKKRNNIKEEFRAAVLKLRHSLYSFIPLEEISNYVLKRYPIPDSLLLKMSISQIFYEAQSVVDSVETWERQDIINPQNFKLPLSFKSVKEISLLILAIIALFLQYHFLNYKYYETNFFGNRYKSIKVPAINNIIQNLEIPFLSSKFIISMVNKLSYITNSFFPIIVLIILGRQFYHALHNYTFFYIAIFVYLTGFIFFIIYIWNLFKVGQKIRYFLFVSLKKLIVKNK